MEVEILGYLERVSKQMEKTSEKLAKMSKWSGQSGVPDFKCNFGIFIFEIERRSEKVKRRKLSKEFDGIEISKTIIFGLPLNKYENS